MARMTFTITEAANLLGIGRTAAYQAARDGKIPIITIGGRRLVPVGLFEKFLGVEPGSISLPPNELKSSGLEPNND
jgi:excisionase family DNA binding protein|tara:strand:- start:235 stop:462 length:228 start_codon:yes stop_codon:yes gene_type:complete